MRVDGPILALDVAKSTGIALGRPGERPVLSTAKFAKWEGATLDEAYGACMRWLADLLAFKPALIVIEAPLPGNAARGAHDVALAFGLQGIIRAAANCRGIRCELGHMGTWRKFFLGSGNLRSGEAKQRAMETCRRLGWNPKNFDEADAAGLWAWSCENYGAGGNPGILPLLAKAGVAA